MSTWSDVSDAAAAFEAQWDGLAVLVVEAGRPSAAAAISRSFGRLRRVIDRGMSLRPGPCAAIALAHTMFLVLAIRARVCWLIWRLS